jgi:4-amino-4-deoxy-L-arabinose transferase-like glycosyltransferase
VSRRARLLSSILVAVGIAAASFVVRAPSLDRAFTIDEKLWIERSDRFVDAVADARFGDTVQSGHPGVTTMWVGGLAQRTLPRDADLRARYARARLWMAAVSVALIVLIWWLVGVVAGGLSAAIAGLLLAFDPYLMTHNRVLHLDGFLALFMVASLLALLAATRDGSRRLLLLSGALAGLAALTKQPAALLIPATLIVLWRDRGGIARRFGWWVLAAAVVAVALWPALWVRPWHAAAIMAGGSGRAVAETSSSGFFLGGRVAQPGPFFYPVALALRTSIVTLPGFAWAVVWAARRRKADATARLVITLFIAAAWFILFLIVAPKKADRYLLPAIVAGDVALAIAAGRWVAAWIQREERKAFRSVVAAAGFVTAFVAHGLPALALDPYQNAAYNWLVGGPITAQHAMVVGWGEGLNETAEHLSRIPGAAGMTVAVSRVTQFADFFAGKTIRIEDSSLDHPGGAHADLVLFYISSVQVGKYEDIWSRYRNRKPFYELRINRIPYVRVYQVTG